MASQKKRAGVKAVPNAQNSISFGLETQERRQVHGSCAADMARRWVLGMHATATHLPDIVTLNVCRSRPRYAGRSGMKTELSTTGLKLT